MVGGELCRKDSAATTVRTKRVRLERIVRPLRDIAHLRLIAKQLALGLLHQTSRQRDVFQEPASRKRDGRSYKQVLPHWAACPQLIPRHWMIFRVLRILKDGSFKFRLLPWNHDVSVE